MLNLQSRLPGISHERIPNQTQTLTADGLINIKAVAPEIFVLSGNKNRGNGIWKNEIGGNQDVREQLVTNDDSKKGQTIGGGGGLLDGLL